MNAEKERAMGDSSVLYVGKFDIASLLTANRNGSGPAQHIHAVSELENLGCRLSILDINGYNTSSRTDFAWQVARAAQNHDVVLAHNMYDIRWLALMRSLKLIPTPLTAFVHSLNKSPIDRLTVQGFDKLFALSEIYRRGLLDCGVPPEKIVYFPYGADTSFYRPKQEAGRHILSVGVCGRDFDTLISAADGMAEQFVLVGQLSEGQKARTGGNVTLHADKTYGLPFDQLLDLYAQAHLVAITHYGSPHPFGLNALVEAMAMGKAVVLTKGPGIDIDPGALGFGVTVPPGDAIALQVALQKLLGNPDQLQEMGKRARELVEQTYNTKNMGSILCRGIKDIFQ